MDGVQIFSISSRRCRLFEPIGQKHKNKAARENGGGGTPIPGKPGDAVKKGGQLCLWLFFTYEGVLAVGQVQPAVYVDSAAQAWQSNVQSAGTKQ